MVDLCILAIDSQEDRLFLRFSLCKLSAYCKSEKGMVKFAMSENNNIRYSQSLKLPRINSYGNPNRISSNNNLNNNYINNYQSININKLDIYNN